MLGTAKLCPWNIKYLIAAILSLFGERAYNKTVKLKRRIKPLLGP